MALGAEKLVCVIDGPILDECGRLILFLTLQDADTLIRKRAKQSEIAANYVKAVGQEDITSISMNGYGNGFSGQYNATFQNGVGFDHGNGLWSSEQGFAIGGLERMSRLNGYLSELAAAAFVCRVSLHYNEQAMALSAEDHYIVQITNYALLFLDNSLVVSFLLYVLR